MVLLLLLLTVIRPDGPCEMGLMEAEPGKQGAYLVWIKNSGGLRVPKNTRHFSSVLASVHSLNLHLRFWAGIGPLLFSGKSIIPFALAIPHNTATEARIRMTSLCLSCLHGSHKRQEARASLTSNSVGALREQEKNTWQPNLHSALSGSRKGIPESYPQPNTFLHTRWLTLPALKNTCR